MGNVNIITDKEGNEIGRADLGLASFACVTDIARKYNSKPFPYTHPEKIDEYLTPAYEKGKPYEIIQLQCFINDKSTFTTEDIPSFEKAAEKYLIQDDGRGPKKILKAIKELIEKYKEITMTYVSTYAAITVTTKEK